VRLWAIRPALCHQGWGLFMKRLCLRSLDFLCMLVLHRVGSRRIRLVCVQGGFLHKSLSFEFACLHCQWLIRSIARWVHVDCEQNCSKFMIGSLIEYRLPGAVHVPKLLLGLFFRTYLGSTLPNTFAYSSTCRWR